VKIDSIRWFSYSKTCNEILAQKNAPQDLLIMNNLENIKELSLTMHVKTKNEKENIL
jgi:hypothetical protein